MNTEDKLIRCLKRCTLLELDDLWIQYLSSHNSPDWRFFKDVEDYVLAIMEGSLHTQGWKSILGLGVDFLYRNNWTMSELINELPKGRVINELYWLSEVIKYAIEIKLYEAD